MKWQPRRAARDYNPVVVSLSVGGRLGPYDVVSRIGAGGMGEVYRARDTKLHREVALKVLPEAFARDPDRLARFEREAQLLASLNHPNIAAIYGFEEGQGAVPALVLELVDGPTLADRILQGPIPLDEALPIARQIADALEAAHDHGVIHRDLKPANVKLRPDGAVKVLEVGLAKAIEGASGTGKADVFDGSRGALGITQSPTLSLHATQAGIILGTAAYMSPEQASGKAVDRRCDLWAFGAVLFEMLSAHPPFTGETVPHVLAAVLKTDPDWARLPSDMPQQIRRLLRRCLEKDRKRRLDSAAAAGLEIDDALAHPEAGSAAQPSTRSRRAASIAVAALLAGALIATLATWFLLRPPTSALRQPSRFAITPTQPFWANPFDRSLAISPDGRRLVYVAAGTGTGGGLMVRQIDRLDTSAVPGIASARSPFFSPDGQWIGFFDGTQIKKVSLGGGAAIPLCAVNGAPRGASWGEDGTIVYATSDPATGLWRVPSGGGQPVALTTPNVAAGEGDHWFPSLLPAGRGVLFTIVVAGQAENSQVAVFDARTGQYRTLMRGTQAEYAQSGHLLFASGRTLLAVRFDLASLQVVGDAVPVVDDVQVGQTTGAANYAVSRTGTLAHVPAGPFARRSLVWVNRKGQTELVKAPPRAYAVPRLSPDGTRVALDIRDQENDIWILDLTRDAALRRLTYGPSADTNPVWASSTHLIFTSNRSGRLELHRQAADGSGMPEQLTSGGNSKYATSLAPDGASVVGHQDGPNTFDVARFPLARSGPDGGPSPEELVSTGYTEHNAELSPNGRYLAYQSNESGPFQVIVRPYPALNGKWTVSSGVGTRPLWARSGKELFYRDEQDGVVAVPVDTSGATFTWGTAHKLFDHVDTALVPDRDYDVSPDGERFLMLTDDSLGRKSEIVVVLDWIEELKAKIPVP